MKIIAADAANRIPTHNGANQVFDNEGQTTANGSQSYTWDARGRLVQAVASGQTVGYGYDALGRRVSRTDASGTMTFQYDGADVVMDREGGGSAYDYLNGLGIDDKLRQSGRAFGTLYFLQDHLGSTAGLTNTSGGLVEPQQQYEAFGASAGSVRTRYGFSGRELDEVTSLMYYRSRWYDQQQGRFLSEDTIGFQGGLNLYGYVGGNPVNLADPHGKSPIVKVILVAAIVEFFLHAYLMKKSREVFPEDPKDRERHCWVNCVSTRIHMPLNPILASVPAETASWFKEASDLFRHITGIDTTHKTLKDALKDAINDMIANHYGQHNAWKVWKSCKEICEECPTRRR